MKKEFAEEVYNILVTDGGAQESERSAFLQAHAIDKEVCREWRFCGKFGFGGKYRSEANQIDFYREDETVKRLQLRDEINLRLAQIGKPIPPPSQVIKEGEDPKPKTQPRPRTGMKEARKVSISAFNKIRTRLAARPWYEKLWSKILFFHYDCKLHIRYVIFKEDYNVSAMSNAVNQIKEDIEFGYHREWLYSKIMQGSYGNKPYPISSDWFVQNEIDWKELESRFKLQKDWATRDTQWFHVLDKAIEVFGSYHKAKGWMLTNPKAWTYFETMEALNQMEQDVRSK